MLSNVLTILGAVIYASASTLQSVFWGQFIIGIGAGNLGVCRAYVAERAELKDRTVQLGYLTAVQFFAFTVLPMLGALLSSFGKYHQQALYVPFVSKIQVDEFSAPALALFIASALSILLLHVLFREEMDPGDRSFDGYSSSSSSASHVSIEALDGLYEQVYTTSMADADIELMQESEPESLRILPGVRSGREDIQADIDALRSTPPTPRLATNASVVALACTVGGCVLNMSVKGTIGVYETMSSSIAIDTLHWSVAHVGSTFAFFGLLGVASIMTLPYLTRWFTDIDLMLGGMSLMLVSTVLLSNMKDLTNIHFRFALWLMYGIGYPIGHTAMLGAFSKVAKYGKQGFTMGMFVAAGSAARIGFPLLTGYLTDQTHINMDIFALVTAQLAATFSLGMYFRRDILQVIGQTDEQRVESE